MKSNPGRLFLLAAAMLCTNAHAASGTLLRDETLRTQASPTAAVAARVGRGTALTIVARRGGWLQVKTARAQGWVRLLSVRTGSGGAGGAGLGDVVGVATHRANPSRVVAVAGVRGLNEEDLKQAKFNAEEMNRLDSFVVSPSAARARAAKEGLVAIKVPELPKPVGNSTPAKSSPWENNQ
jgi:hypothetical protein